VPAPAATYHVSHVVDGDTIDVVGPDGSPSTVRLIGIDTPERNQCGFDAATQAMAALVADKDVVLTSGARDDIDRYGRLLRYVDVEGVDAGRAMIESGLAIARYDSRDGYGEHTREADYIAVDSLSENNAACRTPPTTAPVRNVVPLPIAAPVAVPAAAPTSPASDSGCEPA